MERQGSVETFLAPTAIGSKIAFLFLSLVSLTCAIDCKLRLVVTALLCSALFFGENGLFLPIFELFELVCALRVDLHREKKTFLVIAEDAIFHDWKMYKFATI